MLFVLYCFLIFMSQFQYVLSFGFAGISFTPVRVCLLVMILYDLFTKRGKFTIQKKNNIWLIVLLIWNIWSMISVIWVKNPSGLLMVEIVLFEALGFIFYGQKLITNAERVRTVLGVLFGACVIHNALGWLEITTKIYLFSKYTEKYSTYGYPVSTFTNTNNFGFYLALMCMVLVGILFVSKNRIYRIASIALLASSVMLIFKTGSRGAILDLVIGALLFALLLRKNLKFTLVVISLVGVGLIMLVAFPSLFDGIERIYQNAFNVNVEAVSGSDFYRMQILANGMDFYIDSYGFGVGAGNIEYWQGHYATRFTNNIGQMHNWWLEALVGSGTVIFILVVAAWLITYRKLIQQYILGTRRNLTATLITFGIIFGVGCVSPSTLYHSEWAWAMLAIFFLISNDPGIMATTVPEAVKKRRIAIRFGKRALRA